MSDTKKTVSATTVTSGIGRFSFMHVWEPSAVNEGDDKKYSVSFLWPKTDTATTKKMQAGVDAAIEAGKTSKFEGKIKGLKLPIRDGDEDRDDEAYKGHWFVNASSKTRPGIVDKTASPILDQEEVYSGCYGRVSINFYPFSTKGNKGVAAGLNHIMKTKDGEPLSGRQSASTAVADVIEEENDLI